MFISYIFSTAHAPSIISLLVTASNLHLIKRVQENKTLNSLTRKHAWNIYYSSDLSPSVKIYLIYEFTWSMNEHANCLWIIFVFLCVVTHLYVRTTCYPIIHKRLCTKCILNKHLNKLLMSYCREFKASM